MSFSNASEIPANALLRVASAQISRHRIARSRGSSAKCLRARCRKIPRKSSFWAKVEKSSPMRARSRSVSAMTIASLERKYRYRLPGLIPASAATSCMVVRWKPERTKQRSAASRIRPWRSWAGSISAMSEARWCVMKPYENERSFSYGDFDPWGQVPRLAATLWQGSPQRVRSLIVACTDDLPDNHRARDQQSHDRAEQPGRDGRKSRECDQPSFPPP